jgi:hypothetical protein
MPWDFTKEKGTKKATRSKGFLTNTHKHGGEARGNMWLKKYATDPCVTVSIPEKVIRFFQSAKSLQPHYDPEVDLPTNTNE